MLHLTNGDCAVPPLRAAGVEGEILPWREILHDGPVPNLDPDAQNVNERGLAVLAGSEEWEPGEERWLGGIRIPAGRSPWRWDPEALRVTEPG